MLKPYDVISGLLTSHLWQIDQHRSTTNSVGLSHARPINGISGSNIYYIPGRQLEF